MEISVIAEIFNFKFFEVVFHWRSSSFQAFAILIWSPAPKFEIWGSSDQWLLRYSKFDILRSSIGGHLLFKHFQFWFGPLCLILKFEDNPIGGCWDIQLLIYWGHFPLEVVFISSILILTWSPEPKFEIWRRSDQWLLRYSTIFWGRLPLEVVFISSIFNFDLVPWASVSNLRMIQSVVAEIFKFNILRSSLFFKHF